MRDEVGQRRRTLLSTGRRSFADSHRDGILALFEVIEVRQVRLVHRRRLRLPIRPLLEGLTDHHLLRLVIRAHDLDDLPGTGDLRDDLHHQLTGIDQRPLHVHRVIAGGDLRLRLQALDGLPAMLPRVVVFQCGIVDARRGFDRLFRGPHQHHRGLNRRFRVIALGRR